MARPYKTVWHLVSEEGEALCTLPGEMPERWGSLAHRLAGKSIAWAETDNEETIDLLLAALVRGVPRYEVRCNGGRRLVQVRLESDQEDSLEWFLLEPLD